MARTNAHQMRESCSANLSYHRKFSSLSLRRQFFHQTRTEIGLGKLRIWCCELNLAFILFKWYYTLTFLLFAIIGSDYSTQLQASAMVSELYKLCVKASQRADGSIDLCNKDAIAYARWVCICVSSIIFSGYLLGSSWMYYQQRLQRCYGYSETWRAHIPTTTPSRKSTQTMSAFISIIRRLRWQTIENRRQLLKDWRKRGYSVSLG